MAVDVLRFPDLIDVEKQLLTESENNKLGRYYSGAEESALIGNGLEIDGLRDYEPGDEARHIDWIRSAQRADGGLYLRRHFADQAPLTVFVSDAPRHDRYAETLGNPLSARSLAFIVGHLSLKANSIAGSPMIGVWSDGYSRPTKTISYEGENGARKIIESGLNLAGTSTELFTSLKAQADNKKWYKRSREAVQTPELEDFSETVKRASRLAQRYADVARFIIVSDFRSNTEATAQQLRTLKNIRNCEVIAFQITNPLFRGIPSEVRVLNSSNAGSKNDIIDSEQKRQQYADRAVARQAEIDEMLKNATTKTITIDTMNPKLGRIA
jgi:hypothetical protein